MKMIKDAVQKPEVSFWLAIILPLLGFATSWGVMTAKIDNMSEKGAKLRTEVEQHAEYAEKRQEKTDSTLLDIQVRLAEIQKDILFIKQSLK